MHGACLPVLAVKTLRGEGSLLVWGGSVGCNILEPPVKMWSTGTVGQWFVFSVHCVKVAPVTSSV